MFGLVQNSRLYLKPRPAALLNRQRRLHAADLHRCGIMAGAGIKPADTTEHGARFVCPIMPAVAVSPTVTPYNLHPLATMPVAASLVILQLLSHCRVHIQPEPRAQVQYPNQRIRKLLSEVQRVIFTERFKSLGHL